MHTFKKVIRLFSILFVAGILSLSCTKEQQQTETTDPLVIGAIYNLTGPQAALDIPSSQGAQLAAKEINQAGGVNNQDIQLVLKDGETDLTVLPKRVDEVLSEFPSTAAFLGLSDSDQVLAAAKAAADQQRVFLTSGATSPQLPGQIPDYLFLACFGDNVQAAAAAEWAYNVKGARTTAIVYDSTQIFTRLLQGYFKIRFEQLGGQVLVINGYNQSDLSQIAQGIQQADITFLSTMPQNVLEGVRLVRQSGFTGPIVSGDGFDSNELWQGQSDLNDLFFATHAYLGADNPDAKVQAFRAAYMEAYDGEEPSAFAALGYDAVKLLAQASENVNSTDPDQVRQALAALKNFEGVTGLITFDGGNIPNKSTAIMEVQSGSTSLVTNWMPEEVPNP